MSLAPVCRVKPFSWLIDTKPENDSLKNPLLRRQAPNVNTRPQQATVRPRTQRMSLDDWVFFEESHWQNTCAREASQRIKAMQRKDGDDLNLACLRLHTIPPIAKSQKLTRLWLTGNTLGRIADDLGDLPNLKILHLENCLLHEIPDFKKYPKLKMLSISGNPIHHIPSSLARKGVAVLSLYTLVEKYQRREYCWVQRRRKVRSVLNCLSPSAAKFLLPLPDELDRIPF